MTIRQKGIARAKLPPLKILKEAARAGDACAHSNIPLIYRDAGNLRRAFFWWKRLAESEFKGDAFVDIGYCLMHGIGVRRNLREARIAFERAMQSKWISQWQQEEAMYLLAVCLLESPSDNRARVKAMALLARANKDSDFPEAGNLLQQVEAGSILTPCRCRRGLRRSIRGQAPCQIHNRPRRS